MVLDGFGWFWMVFRWFRMDWDGLGPTTTPTTATSTLIHYPYYSYFYPFLEFQGASRGCAVFRVWAGTRQKLYKTDTLEWFLARIINPDIKFELANR